MNTFNRVKELVLAQGIISRIAILPETDLVLDLNYKPADLAELFRMVDREFKINTPPEEYCQITRLKRVVTYIQASCQFSEQL